MTDFAERLALALEMNGFTNASFAAALGEYGQQNVNGWKKRGQIGGPSGARVIELLPKTDFGWLQYGVGDPERFSKPKDINATGDFRQSYFPRLDPATIRNVLTGLTWRFKMHGQEFDLDRDADLFSLAYAFAAGGDEETRGELQAAVDARIAQLTGEQRGQTEVAPRGARSGPN